MMSGVRWSHSFEVMVRYCSVLIFVGTAPFFGVPEGFSAPQSAPTVKDLLDAEPEKGATPSVPAVESSSPAVTKVEMASDGATEHSAHHIDELDPGVPRNAVKGFFLAGSERDFERAARYLDLRNLGQGLDESKGPELARKLYIILTRSVWIDVEQLSVDPKGYLDDGLPSYRDPLGEIETPGKTYSLLLQKVKGDQGKTVWKISNRTVRQIPELYAQLGHGILEDLLPHWVFDFEILGVYVWEWMALAVGALGGYLLVLIVTGPILFLLRRKDTELCRQILRVFPSPVRFLLFMLLINYWLLLINPSFTLQAVVQAGTFRLIAFAWFLMSMTDFSVDRLRQHLRKKGQAPTTVFFPVLGNAVKIVIVILAVMFWFKNLGFEVTALFAGLGIGGLAVALAAQKSLENFFGAITLYLSKPVSIGEFCRFGDRVGTIEEIGLRSTLVRTLDHSIVSVPNGEFSNLQLENYSKRQKIWYHPRIRLRYDTTPDQLRYILVEVRKVLYGHPKVLADPARIRFIGFGESSLELDIFAYIDVTDYGEYLEVAEDLNLRIMDVITKAGSGFALPQQLYVERSKGVDAERAREAEAEVSRWKEEQALYLPNFPRDQISSLQGTLDYPPLGSPGASVAGH